jgi:hypothetical protein
MEKRIDAKLDARDDRVFEALRQIMVMVKPKVEGQG